MAVILDDGTLKSTLPDVANRFMATMVTPGVGHRQRLEDTADRRSWFGAEKEVEVIRHQAIAIKPKRITQLGLAQAVKEGKIIVLIGEDDLAIIAAVDRVINQAIIIRPQRSSHEVKFRTWESRFQQKNELTPIFCAGAMPESKVVVAGGGGRTGWVTVCGRAG